MRSSTSTTDKLRISAIKYITIAIAPFCTVSASTTKSLDRLPMSYLKQKKIFHPYSKHHKCTLLCGQIKLYSTKECMLHVCLDDLRSSRKVILFKKMQKYLVMLIYAFSKKTFLIFPLKAEMKVKTKTRGNVSSLPITRGDHAQSQKQIKHTMHR